MTKSAFTGPIIAYGDRNPAAIGSSGQSNPDKAASIFDRGVGLMDGRAGYNVTKPGAVAYLGTDSMVVLDAVPAALAANNIAAAQAAVSGTPLTLAAASTGVTVVPTGGVKVWASGNLVPAGALVLDGTPGLLTQYGGVVDVQTGYSTVSFYDTSKTIARNVRITTNGDDSAGFYTVAGYDIYGYPMTERITGVSSAVAAGKKAFKFITSVTPSGTVNSAGVTVGTGDVIGFPLLATSLGYVTVWWNNTMGVTATTPFGTASAFVFADTTSPATNTTGDVRGTIYLGTANASNGTRRLQVIWTPSILAQVSQGGTFGVTQA